MGSYEHAEREMKLRDARAGIIAHAHRRAPRLAIVMPINTIVANEFPWSAVADALA